MPLSQGCLKKVSTSGLPQTSMAISREGKDPGGESHAATRNWVDALNGGRNASVGLGLVPPTVGYGMSLVCATLTGGGERERENARERERERERDGLPGERGAQSAPHGAEVVGISSRIGDGCGCEEEGPGGRGGLIDEMRAGEGAEARCWPGRVLELVGGTKGFVLDCHEEDAGTPRRAREDLGGPWRGAEGLGVEERELEGVVRVPLCGRDSADRAITLTMRSALELRKTRGDGSVDVGGAAGRVTLGRRAGCQAKIAHRWRRVMSARLKRAR
ncbi:hypothetical protein B0H11DRAFT_1920269 [Mycena galericulata]|nr:hypothetical protein B0H11DRAFT_1920269 [Mycena galericulata]